MTSSKPRAWYQNIDPDNAAPHVVFDLSIPLPERRDKAMVYPSSNKAAEALGVAHTTLYKYRQRGKRLRAADGKEYAVRLAYGEFLDRLKK